VDLAHEGNLSEASRGTGLPSQRFGTTRAPRYREALIPFAAWPLCEVFVTLEDWLDSLPPTKERPIVGTATEEEFTRRLTTFLLGPLLAADRDLRGNVADSATMQLIRSHDDRPEKWARLLRSLGEMWHEALRETLGTANIQRGD